MPNMVPRWVLRCGAATVIVAVLGGCTLNERAEAVYLRQQRASTALIEAIVAAEDENPALAESLYDTEAAFNDVCAPLRRASYRRLYAEEIEGDLEWAIFLALEDCASKTGDVERLLWQVDPENARYYLGSPDLASAPEQD
ncbi:MAG: hypothetical protein ACE5KF_11080 [Kiloniellaceae bacterium]